MTAELILQGVAAALTFAAGGPQMLRALRGSVEGVSGGTWASLSGVAILWTLWSIAADVPLLAVSEGVFAASAAIVAWRCWAPLRALTAGVCAFAGCAALGIGFGEIGFGVAGIIASVVCRLPQLRRAWTAPGIGGVSSFSWWLMLGSSLAWVGVGITAGDIVLILGSGLTAVVSVLILVVAVSRAQVLDVVVELTPAAIPTSL